MDKTSSRQYPVQAGSISITQAELNLIKENAAQLYVDSTVSDRVGCIVEATLMHLVHKGLLNLNKLAAGSEGESTND